MPCFLCLSSETPMVCPGCERVKACSEDHMQVHESLRPKDGKTCTPFIVGRKPGIGKVILASRSIGAGEAVFVERPSVEGPDSKSYPVCVNCLKNLSNIEDDNGSNKGEFCSKCGFPVCGVGCENGENHVLECEDLSGSKSECLDFPPNKTCFPYSAIFPLRILKMKERNPEAWRRIQLLMDHVQGLEEDMRALYQKTADFILTTCNVTKYTSEEILRALGIFRTNGVNQGLLQGFGLYSTFSFLSHSCSPNASYQIYLDHSLILRATQNISEGEEITISYLPIYQSTFRRRMKIKNNWMFDCLCKRCQDPTEFGTFLSGVVCNECKEGTLLPKDPTDSSSTWICTQCSFSTSSSSVCNSVFLLESNLELFLDEDPSIIESKIHSYGKVLHPNQYLIFLLRRRLLDNLCNRQGSMESRETLEKILTLASNILEITNLLEPGLSSTRGRILKQVHKPSLLLAKMDLREGKINSSEFTRRTKHIIRNMKIAIRSLEDYGLDHLTHNYEKKVAATVSKISLSLIE